MGIASTLWRLGDTAGVQEIEAYLWPIGDDDLPIQVFAATALPGSPTSLAIPSDTIVFDALRDTLTPLIDLRDRAGNSVAGPFELVSATPAIVTVTGTTALISAQNGVGRVLVTTGAHSFPIVVRVTQVPVGLKMRERMSSLHWIGAGGQLVAEALDRNGAAIGEASPSWLSLAPSLVEVNSSGHMLALGTGTVVVVAKFSGFTDSAVVSVDQVPATVVVSLDADTLELDERIKLPVQVLDSGGSVIASPHLVASSDDSAVMTPVSGDSLLATYPGAARVTVTSGAAQVTIDLIVEGVALLVDGVRTGEPSAIAAARTLELSNGRIRLRWHPKLGNRGGFEMDTDRSTWYASNVRGAGDWLYVTASVITEPTSIAIIDSAPGQIGLAMRFANHRFDPGLGYPPNYQNEPFPFTRTVWLRSHDYGYFSWTESERTMVWTGLELGGRLWRNVRAGDNPDGTLAIQDGHHDSTYTIQCRRRPGCCRI